MKKLTTIALVLTNSSTRQTLHPQKIQLALYALQWFGLGSQFNSITIPFSSPPQLWIWACIYKVQWIGIVEIIMGEVAIRSYQEGSWIQPTQFDRDKGGHEAHVLEASRIHFFFHFYQGYRFCSFMTERFRWEPLQEQSIYVVSTLFYNRTQTVLNKVPLIS